MAAKTADLQFSDGVYSVTKRGMLKVGMTDGAGKVTVFSLGKVTGANSTSTCKLPPVGNTAGAAQPADVVLLTTDSKEQPYAFRSSNVTANPQLFAPSDPMHPSVGELLTGQGNGKPGKIQAKSIRAWLKDFAPVSVSPTPAALQQEEEEEEEEFPAPARVNIVSMIDTESDDDDDNSSNGIRKAELALASPMQPSSSSSSSSSSASGNDGKSQRKFGVPPVVSNKKQKVDDDSVSTVSRTSSGNSKTTALKPVQLLAPPSNTLQETEGLTASAVFLVNFKRCFFYNVLDVPDPLNMLSHPDKKFGARPSDRTHIDHLKVSFQCNSSINKNIQVVVINTTLYNLMRNDMAHASRYHHSAEKAANYVSPPSLTLEALLANKETSPLYVIVGNHTRQALGELQQQYPRQSFFKCSQVVFYLCPETPETDRALPMLSMIDNKAQALHKENTFSEDIFAMHDNIMHQISVNRGALDVAQIRDDYALSTGYTKELVGQYMQIAKLRGNLWNLYERLLKGDFNWNEAEKKGGKDKKPKAPNSCANLCRHGGVPEDKQAEWLQDVLNCNITLNQFKENCLKFKARIRLKNDIINLLHMVGRISRPERAEKKQQVVEEGKGKKKRKKKEEKETEPCEDISWSEVIALFPELDEEAFLEPWVQSYLTLKIKAQMPVNLRDSVENLTSPQALEKKNKKAHALETSGDHYEININGFKVDLHHLDATIMGRGVEAGNFAMLYFDMAFGIGGQEWDKVHTSDDELRQIIKSFRAVQRKTGYVVVLCVSWRHTDEIVEVLEELDFGDIQPVYWHKEYQNEAGDPGRWTSAVETFIVAMDYQGGSKLTIQKKMSKNPLDRHNLFHMANDRIHLKYSDKSLVNHHQKPPGVIQFFLSKYVNPGDSIMIVGAGAGGDVMGAVLSSHHVVAMERDRKQFEFLRGFLATYDPNQGKKPEAGDEASVSVIPACPVCGMMGDARPKPLEICTVCGKMVCDGCYVDCGNIKICDHPLCAPNGELWQQRGLEDAHHDLIVKFETYNIERAKQKQAK